MSNLKELNAAVDMGVVNALPEMSLSGIAVVIRKDWAKRGKGVSPYAKPYLDAMASLSSIKDNYILASGASVVAYFLANAGSWRGDMAKAVKKELNKRLKESGYA